VSTQAIRDSHSGLPKIKRVVAVMVVIAELPQLLSKSEAFWRVYLLITLYKLQYILTDK
jgi:predicted membrane-bound dolichyl-phosphate-mannose-protein mannosyltransferase